MKPTTQRVVVPENLKRNVPDGAILPTTREDLRRYARRASSLNAQVEILNAWSVENPAEWIFSVPVSNISRNGACFLHHEQLYPDDQVILDFGSFRRQFQVTRCRRLGDQCYEIGAQVASG